MQVQNGNNSKMGVISEVAFPAIAGGVIAQSCHELMMPADFKFALRNTRMSQDKFVSNFRNLAEQTLKNIEAGREAQKAARMANGIPYINFDNAKIDVEKVVERAKEVYPELQKTAKIAKKSLNRTLIATTALIAGIKIASMIFFNKKYNKQHSQQLQGQSVKSTTA